jgi:hypothetical protein
MTALQKTLSKGTYLLKDSPSDLALQIPEEAILTR